MYVATNLCTFVFGVFIAMCMDMIYCIATKVAIAM